MDQYYSLKEVGDKLQVSRRTLYRYIDAGKLKAVKIGGAWKISSEALNSFLSGAENGEEEK